MPEQETFAHAVAASTDMSAEHKAHWLAVSCEHYEAQLSEAADTVRRLEAELATTQRERNKAQTELLNVALRIRRATSLERPLNHSGPFLEWWEIGLQARGIIERADADATLAEQAQTEPSS